MEKAGRVQRKPRGGKSGSLRTVQSPQNVEPKLTSKQARLERQRARAQELNDSPEWFGLERFESITSVGDSRKVLLGDSKKDVQKPSTLTGFRELPVRDMLVILGLWFVRLFIPWVTAWHEFNLHLLADPSHLAMYERYFMVMSIAVFIGKCALCLGFALLVDLVNFKYPTFLLVLILYVFAPIAGVVVLALLIMRGYDRQYYHEWWHKSVVMMKWAMSVPFITFPLQFSCIFDQITDMSRHAHYNWIAIFVFIEVVNACAAYWVIPPNCPTGYFTLFAVWAVIGVLILCLMIEVLSLMTCAKPQIKRLNLSMCCKNTLTDLPSETERKTPGKADIAELKPTESTEPTRHMRMWKLIWFLFMLIPAIFTSVVYEILERTRPEEDWDKHVLITATGMLICGQCLGVLIVTVVLFVFRKWLKALYRTRLLKPDVLALGLPLSINVVALVVIMGRLVALSSLQQGDIILGPIPTSEVSVIEFFNVEFRNRTVCVHSEHFGSLKVPPRQRVAAVIPDPGGGSISFNVTLDPRTVPSIPTTETFTYKKGVWVTYIITLNISDLGASDIEAYYSKLVVLKVNGTEDIRPKQQPQVILVNTYVNIIVGWFYNVTGSNFTDSVPSVTAGLAILKEYPPGNLEITYWTEFEELVKKGNPPVTVLLPVENYCVYVVLLCLYDKHKNPSNHSEPVPRSLQAHKTMEIAGPEGAPLPTKMEMEKDVILIVGMALAGMAKAGVYVGYLYLFWLDYPCTSFRTTFLAGFWILIEVPAELAAIKVVDITVKVVAVLLVLQILCTALHFGTSIFLYTSKFNFRNRPD